MDSIGESREFDSRTHTGAIRGRLRPSSGSEVRGSETALGGEPQAVAAAAGAHRFDRISAGDLGQERRHRVLARDPVSGRAYQTEPLAIVDRLARPELVSEDLDRDFAEPLAAQIIGLKVNAELRC
jgi:hypothetical protein